MRVRVNGEWRESPDGASVAALVEAMSLDPRRIAVELNKQLVPRSRHSETRLSDGDELEIVTLVGGG